MKKAIIILSVLVLIVGSCKQSLYAQFKIPTGYLEIESIYIDFDGDGKKDTAAVIIKEKSDYYYFAHAFVIYLTSSNKNHIMEFGEGVGHATALKVKNNVIQFGYVLGGSGVYSFDFKLRYNHTERKIQLIGFDTSYRIASSSRGYCEKSYNLLTGDYNVTNYLATINYTDLREREHKEFHKGNHKIKAVFLEDINDEMIENLDLVGEEFERR